MPRAGERRRGRAGSVVFWVVVALIVVFILAPLAVAIGSSVTETGYLTFPPKGFTLKWFAAAANDPKFLEALWTSLQLGAATTVISVLAGVLASYAIVRRPGVVTGALEQVLLSPILLPAVVLGLGVLFALSLSGWLGTFPGGLLAHVIIASPFVTRSVLAGLRRLDPALDEASRSLGAGATRTFCRIVLPSLRGAIIGGAVFAFVISFDEAVVTLFLTGSGFTTLPITIFTYVQYSNNPTIAAVSTVIVLVSAVLVGLVTRGGGQDER
ncbi:ABC transporter permease [Amycolatopsis sp. NPDC051903]|uniref:ABC transporter permease n=1 Tax=Amycolatopsis sp. NPDC051903 TaxID=3363936 RepID=UPI0037A450F1